MGDMTSSGEFLCDQTVMEIFNSFCSFFWLRPCFCFVTWKSHQYCWN